MVGGKRQEWIFEFINGPDIVPVRNCSGKYTPQRKFTILAGEEAFELGPDDVLDLSDHSHLLIHEQGRSQKLAWDSITGLAVENVDARAETLTRPETAVSGAVFPTFATDKKAP